MKNLKNTSGVITKVASLVTIIVGCLALSGWFFDIPSFKSILPGIITIKFNTAVCFILSGIAIYLLNALSISQTRKIIASACSWIVLITAILNLSEYIFGHNLGIDELLWREGPGTVATTFPGRMSINTAINFTLLGVIFLMLGKKKYHWPIQILLIAMIPASLLVILNYLFGTSFLNSIPQLNATALHTAILFIVLCLGVFFSPVLGYLRFSFQKKIASFFVLIFLILTILFFTFNKNNEQIGEEKNLAKHTHRVLILADEVNTQAYQMQSGVSSYIMTGEDNFPLLLNNSADTIYNMIGRLRLITKDNAVHQLRIDTLEKLLSTYITFQKDMVNIRRKEGFEGAQKKFLKGQGKLLLNGVDSIVTAIEQEETQTMAKRESQIEQSIQNSSKIFNLFQLIAGMLLLIALIIIYKNSRMRNKAEEALRKSLKEVLDYKHALDESSLLVITDQDGIIRQVNDNFCKVTKYMREELLGQDHRIINSGYHTKEFIRDLWIIINNGEVWKGEIKNRAKDGSYFWLDTTIVPFMNEHGKPYQYVAIRSDITQRKKLEEEIRQLNQDLQKRVGEKTEQVIEKEQQHRFLLQNMREGIQVVGFDWRYLFVNKSAEEQIKYSNEELLGHTIMEKYPGIENSEFFKMLQGCMKDRRPQIIENEFTFPDGTKQWFELSIQPVPEGLFILSMDITQRKIAEEATFKERDLSNSIINSLPGLFFLVDETGKNLLWNKNMETVSGYSAAEMSKRHPLDFFDDDEKELAKKKITDLFIHGKADLEAHFRTKTKEKIPYYFSAWRIIYEGNPCMMGVGIDITERKQVEEKLQESERFLNESQEVSKIGSYVLDINTGEWKSSHELDNIFGFTADDKRTVEEWIAIIHPDHQKMMQDYFAKEVVAKKQRFDKEYKIINKKTGKECWVHGIGDLEINSVGSLVKMLGTIQDITERKKTEAKLQESLDRYELVNKATRDIIWEWDLETNEIFRSPLFLTIFGYTNEQVMSKRDWVFDKIHPDDTEKVVRQLDYCIKNNIEKWQESYRILAADGTYKYVYDRAFILFNEKGKPRRMIGAMTDLTEKKKLEKELSEQRLKQQKLITEVTIQTQEKEKNELGRELHDNINQILATVKMYLGMAKSGQTVSEDLVGMSYEYVNQAMEEIRKLSHALVAPSLGNVSLKVALQELIEGTNLLNGLRVQLLVDEKINKHEIDKDKELMFYRIVQEQLSNITKYAQAKEAIIILKNDNRNLSLSIADNGVGFDTSEKNKGIGLKNISNRVEFYLGNMNIISAPGKGCTLEVSIPLCYARDAQPAAVL